MTLTIPRGIGPPTADSPPVDAFIVLAADQIRTALAEAGAAFGLLTADVLALVRDAADAPAEARDALMRLQAIDRLGQRIGNVDRNLRALACLLRETGQQPSPRDWMAFMATVRGGYTTETERAEFDAVHATTRPTPGEAPPAVAASPPSIRNTP